MNQAANDLELLKRIAAGEETAVRSLYVRHNLRIYRFVLRLVRNDAIAEEIVNEVFLDIWRQAQNFTGGSAVSTWIFAIARNKAISVIRKRTESALDDQMTDHLMDTDDTPEVTAQKADKGDVIRGCINGLSDEHREVIDLVYYHEKSVREVAEIINIPESTVKTRMFYARKQLSELLKEAGIDRGWP